MSKDDIMVVDTNIWMDYLFGDRAGNNTASAFFTAAKRSEANLVVPPHSLCDVFFLTRQELKRANRADGKQTPEEAAVSARVAAWAAIDLIMELATVGPSDQMDAIIASKNRSSHGDYEDNLVVACALRTKARWLVTSDQKLIQHSPVATLTPEDACRYLED